MIAHLYNPYSDSDGKCRGRERDIDKSKQLETSSEKETR